MQANSNFTAQVSAATKLSSSAVAAVVGLAADGATVPFLARYRKEATGGLDETQIRSVLEHAERLEALDKRRRAIVTALEKSGQATGELLTALQSASTRAELEDLYLPFRVKRKTRAEAARLLGLEPLAKALWNQGTESVEGIARAHVRKSGPVDVAAALQGARDLCAERFADTAAVRKRVREAYFRQAIVHVTKAKAFEGKATKFDGQVGPLQRLERVASHTWLSCCRGESEGVLKLRFDFDSRPLCAREEQRLPRGGHSSARQQRVLWLSDAMTRLLVPAAKAEARRLLDERAQKDGIEVFAANLQQLLLAAPLGARPVLGIDPGQRTGCKCALVDATGKLLDTAVLQLVQGSGRQQQAAEQLHRWLRKIPTVVVAVGNGTHGRETLQFAQGVLEQQAASEAFCVSVNEAGASVYSASETARKEFPDLDVTFRGAVSIARRLQDPLAELVKVEPKSLGVGQYQHDMDPCRLDERLRQVVESCVSTVGVDLNTASAPLLCQVGGLGPKLAQRIVDYRHEHGAFVRRQQLLRVAGLGPKAFEQVAGFLRVVGGDQVLDATAVHPERYDVVQQMAQRLDASLPELLGDTARLRQLTLEDFPGASLGQWTLRDIVDELCQPGRDPREEFSPPQFAAGVQRLEDVQVGMVLAGVVTNVAAFGAFVDIGVHQDGLVHISRLANGFVRNPSEVVAVGQNLQVEVLQVDLERRRIGLARVFGQ